MTKFYVLTLLILMALLPFNGKSQNHVQKIGSFQIAEIGKDSCETIFVEPDENIRIIFSDKLDSLVHSWYVKKVYRPDSREYNSAPHANLDVSDSVIIERLQNIHSDVALPYNDMVRSLIEMYMNRRSDQTSVIMGLSEYYFPIFEEIFDRYNLPLELVNVSIIESALNPVAASRMGAVGLWQITFPTAKQLKLEITTHIDERCDVLKATDAAARYLRELYDIFGDWHLVIAAYNCGPGNVQKAIKRAGGKADFWKIYYALPRETRGYVPAFIAATYMTNYYQEHNIMPSTPPVPLVTDTLMVGDYLNLKQVADMLDIDIFLLRNLNAMYRKDIIPASEQRSLPLRLPLDKTYAFIDKMEEIYSHEREKYFPNNKLVVPEALASSANSYSPVNLEGKARITYTVKSGDNPGYIAQWYNVRLNDLKDWNNMSRNLIKPGQKLVVYVPEGKKQQYERIEQMSFDAKQEMVKKNSPQTEKKENAEPDGNYEYYVVQAGDNLWDIAKKFPGTTDDQIKNL
ncbi:MAG: transglycosylase SLT domain-containing protein, partial [Prolixibacteraceae bacterium]|nr:transglycosylase SLT domain-containing protein [Prolixibacteraceae bacterium]